MAKIRSGERRASDGERTSEITLRAKHQLTLPSEVVLKMGLHAGQRFLVELQSEGLFLRPIPESFAGSLAGVYGSSDEANAHVEHERSAWE